jgi:ribosomal protein S25
MRKRDGDGRLVWIGTSTTAHEQPTDLISKKKKWSKGKVKDKSNNAVVLDKPI